MFMGNTQKFIFQQDLLHAPNMIEFVNSLFITFPFDMNNFYIPL